MGLTSWRTSGDEAAFWSGSSQMSVLVNLFLETGSFSLVDVSVPLRVEGKRRWGS